MPKILKSSQFKLDDSNKISIDISAVESQPEEVFEMEPEEYAESIISIAQKRADDIVGKAKSLSDEIYAGLDETVRKAKEDGHEQGRSSGYVEGYNEGVAQTDDLRSKAEQAYKNALIERENLLESIEPEIVDLITQILDKLISTEIEINPRVIIYMIKKGLSSSTATGRYKIMVSKEDYETVSAEIAELAGMLDGSSQLDIVRDSSLQKTDCVIETPFGSIDCGLGRQFDSLKRNLYYILNNRNRGNG